MTASWQTGHARLAHQVEHRTFNPAGWVRVPGRAPPRRPMMRPALAARASDARRHQTMTGDHRLTPIHRTAPAGVFDEWEMSLHGRRVVYRIAGSGPPVVLI